MALTGVYVIQNLVTGRFYIGSSVNTRSRWNDHKAELRRGRHHSSYLQRSWNKYGEQSFVFSVIEICNASNLVAREQYWLDALKPYNGRGYNIRKDARAYYVTDSQKNKLRQSALRPERLANSRKQLAVINSNITPEQIEWRREHMRKLNASKTAEQMLKHQSDASKARWAKEAA